MSKGNHQFVQDPVGHCRVWALQEKEKESTGSEDKNEETVHEDRKDVASRNDVYLLHFFSVRLDGICLPNYLVLQIKKV